MSFPAPGRRPRERTPSTRHVRQRSWNWSKVSSATVVACRTGPRAASVSILLLGTTPFQHRVYRSRLSPCESAVLAERHVEDRVLRPGHPQLRRSDHAGPGRRQDVLRRPLRLGVRRPAPRRGRVLLDGPQGRRRGRGHRPADARALRTPGVLVGLPRRRRRRRRGRGGGRGRRRGRGRALRRDAGGPDGRDPGSDGRPGQPLDAARTTSARRSSTSRGLRLGTSSSLPTSTPRRRSTPRCWAWAGRRCR